MLLRGQNLLGYRHYEDEVVDRFVAKAAENGMDVFRVFDALNDVRNVEQAIAAVKRAGKHAQGTHLLHGLARCTPSRATSSRPASWWRSAATRCASRTWRPCSSRSPPTTSSRRSRTPSARTSGSTSTATPPPGVTLVCLMKAIEAGADVVDTAICSISLGPGHNPTESLVEMLEGRRLHDRPRHERLLRIKDHFAASARATPSSCPGSPASRPRSSPARSPAG